MIEAVRKRPGMYIGGTDGYGVQNLVLEVVANAYDQYLAGRCSRVAIDVAADGTVTIDDDGPGLAAGGGDGVPPLHELLTQWSDRPTVDGHRPHAHLGASGAGLFVVNALSERFEIATVRAGMRTTAAYARGEQVEPVASSATTEPAGTQLRFRPDPEIFTHPRVPAIALTRELEDLSFLAPRLALYWAFASDAAAVAGLAARVATTAGCDRRRVASHTATYDTPTGPIDVGVALTWCRDGEPQIDSFVNLRRTRSHGSHVDGMLDGTRALFGGTDEQCLTHLVAAVSVVLADVTFGQPSRDQLATPAVRAPVATATTTALERWASANPELAAELRARFAAS